MAVLASQPVMAREIARMINKLNNQNIVFYQYRANIFEVFWWLGGSLCPIMKEFYPLPFVEEFNKTNNVQPGHSNFMSYVVDKNSQCAQAVLDWDTNLKIQLADEYRAQMH